MAERKDAELDSGVKRKPTTTAFQVFLPKGISNSESNHLQLRGTALLVFRSHQL
jgi:hypothetical protein